MSSYWLLVKRLNPKTGKPFTNGDVREDGYIFRRYNLSKKRPNGEYYEQWYSPERYAYGQLREKSYNAKRAQTLRNEVHEYKVSKGCADCGYNEHGAALDFDHRPGEKKLFNIGQRPHTKAEHVWEEIQKCDVVCANCHRIRTWERGTDFSQGQYKPRPSRRQRHLAA